MPNRLQSEIDNVKKFQPIGGSLASVLLLLTLSALSTVATTWNEPILAQSAPTDPQLPVRGDDRQNNNLWWLLILIPIGGVLWASSRSRRQNPQDDATVTPPIVPNMPVSSIDPVLSDGSASQPDRVDPNLVVERERQRVRGLADDAATLSSANGNGHPQDPLVTTPPVVVPIDARSTRSTVVGEEFTINHDKTPEMPLAAVPEPDRHLIEHIQLLEERLIVDRRNRKVGEVIVRKEVETRFVRVPIQREVLIVEQVEPEFKQLAVVDLGQIPTDSTALDERISSTVAANFTSAATAIEFLQSLAARSPRGSQNLQLNLAIADPDTQAFYRQWLAQRSVEAT
jgi:Domain of unknown function (DUF2382)